MGHLAALPSPSLAQACGPAGAGRRGSGLPAGAVRGGNGHRCACGCREEGRAGGRSRLFGSPRIFSVSAAGGAGARCSQPPGLVPKPPPRAGTAPPRPRGPGAGPVRWAGAGAPRPPGALGAARTALRARPALRARRQYALLDRRPFPLDLTLGVTKAPFYFLCHFGVCLLFPATSRFQGYGRLPAGSGKGQRLQRYLI